MYVDKEKATYDIYMAVTLRAVKDYCKSKDESEKKEILKNLRSPYLSDRTNGLSVIAANELKAHPKEIRKRLIMAERTMQQ